MLSQGEVYVTFAAMDRASISLLAMWQASYDDGIGLVTWLKSVAQRALEEGPLHVWKGDRNRGKLMWTHRNGISFVFDTRDPTPRLIMAHPYCGDESMEGARAAGRA